MAECARSSAGRPRPLRRGGLRGTGNGPGRTARPALRQADRAAGAVVARSVVDEAKQHEELRPGTETLVHGVRVERGVFAQALVEAGERVVPDEGLVLRQHAALLGVEQEDEAQNDGEQTAVDVVAIAFGRERLAQQPSAGSVMGGLEPAQKLVERVHHLLGETLAHLVLVLAAVFQERGEPLAAGQCEEALLGKQQAECGAERAPGGPAHVRDAEVHPAGAFAARGGDEAKRGAVEQQAGGNPGAAKQTLRAPLGRGFKARAGAAGRRHVEVPTRVEHLHEKLPWCFAVSRIALANGEVGTERLTVVRKGKLQLRRNRSVRRAGIPSGRKAPAEDGGRELLEVLNAGLRAARRVEHALPDAADQSALSFRILPVQDRSHLDQRGRRDYEAVRLDEAEPFEVGASVGVGGGHVAVDDLSVSRSAAETPHAEESLVRGPEVLAIPCRIDSPRGARDNVPVLEIIHQQIVVRVQQPCSTCDGKRQNVFVVGFADIPLPEIVRALLDIVVRYRARPAILARVPQPSYESVVAAQLPPKFAANNQLSACTREPVEEASAGRGGIIAEHFVCHVGIDDPAHQRPTERRTSSMKNCP